MRFIVGFFSLQWLRVFDFIPPLLIRLLLAPILWVSGVQRLGLFDNENLTWSNPATWINSDTLQASSEAMSNTLITGLGADTLTLIIGGIEVVGAILLILGFAVRWIVPFLLCVIAYLLVLSLGEAPVGPTAEKLLLEHGYVTMEHSQLEVYITYFILLLTLFFMGAGRWFSLDWFIYKKFTRGIDQRSQRTPRGAAKTAAVDPFEIDATDEPGLAPRRPHLR